METQTPPLEFNTTRDLIETRNFKTSNGNEGRVDTAVDDEADRGIPSKPSTFDKNRPSIAISSGSATDEAPEEGFGADGSQPDSSSHQKRKDLNHGNRGGEIVL